MFVPNADTYDMIFSEISVSVSLFRTSCHKHCTYHMALLDLATDMQLPFVFSLTDPKCLRHCCVLQAMDHARPQLCGLAATAKQEHRVRPHWISEEGHRHGCPKSYHYFPFSVATKKQSIIVICCRTSPFTQRCGH